MHPLTGRILAVTLLWSLATAASLAAETPEDKAIAGVISAFVKPGEPGCTVGVVQDGALEACAGLRPRGPRARQAARHAFDRSISLPFRSSSRLSRYSCSQQQGKLTLDDPLVKYLPELAASAKGVTLRHLVHHTGGLRDYIELLTMRGGAMPTARPSTKPCWRSPGRRSRTRRPASSTSTATPAISCSAS